MEIALRDRGVENIAEGFSERGFGEALRVNARGRRLGVAENFGNALDGRTLFEQERRGSMAHGMGTAGILFAENGRGVVLNERGELLTL